MQWRILIRPSLARFLSLGPNQESRRYHQTQDPSPHLLSCPTRKLQQSRQEEMRQQVSFYSAVGDFGPKQKQVE